MSHLYNGQYLYNEPPVQRFTIESICTTVYLYNNSHLYNFPYLLLRFLPYSPYSTTTTTTKIYIHNTDKKAKVGRLGRLPLSRCPDRKPSLPCFSLDFGATRTALPTCAGDPLPNPGVSVVERKTSIQNTSTCTTVHYCKN